MTLAISSLVFGLMISAIVDFIATDDTYRRLLESMGMDMSVPVIGFLSYIALFLALPLAVFVGFRMGAVRQEEADGRLDNLLVRGVERRRWLIVTTVQALLAAVVLVVACGAGLWAGAELVDAQVTVSQVVKPLVGTLPLVTLFIGISVLAFGLAPRLTVAMPVTSPSWPTCSTRSARCSPGPHAVLVLSPFHHLARLPGAPMTATTAIVMTAVGMAAAAVGIAAFARRDLRGA